MYGFFKRTFDLVASAVLLLILSPILGLIAILVKAKLGSPVLFKQYRPGKDGEIFGMYKFRSMTSETDSDGNLLPDEMRLTSFGAKLRNTSLDELPELFNILKGDMSFVGPRPQLVRDMVFFDEITMRRQSVLPGLTGWAQVNGRNSISWEDKFKYDLEYLDRRSLLFDLKILLLTFGKVFRSEGISSEGMATAEDYGDYLLRTGAVTKAEYDKKQESAKKLLG